MSPKKSLYLRRQRRRLSESWKPPSVSSKSHPTGRRPLPVKNQSSLPPRSKSVHGQTCFAIYRQRLPLLQEVQRAQV